MVTSQQLIKKYGDPTKDQATFERNNMIMFDIDDRVNSANKVIPNRIYVHRHFGPIVNAWLLALWEAGVLSEIKTWDGIFNVRKKRGLNSLSIHAFACALDLNASHNPLGLTRQQCIAKGLTPFSEKFIEVSRPYMDCGADWAGRPDGMHYQIKSTPV